jgi:hypothetical protein
VTAADHVKCLLSPTRIGLFIVRRAGKSGSLDEAALASRISLAAWLDAIKQRTGKEIQVVSKK